MRDNRSSFEILGDRRFEELTPAEKEQYAAARDREATALAEAMAVNLNRGSLASSLQHMLAQTLRRAGIAFSYGDRSEQGYDLDLADLGAKLRVMHRPGPIGEPQDLTAGNVILVQGEDAANAFASLIARQLPSHEGLRN